MNTDNLNLPWSVKEIRCESSVFMGADELIYSVVDSNGEEICTYFDKSKADQVAEAVNSHTQLVERVKELEGVLTYLTTTAILCSDREMIREHGKSALKVLQKKEKE